jgi:D-alanine-D-alanine ligase-like ATP-grasp enzyme
MENIKNSIRTMLIKFGSWEYWPMWAAYLPASLYYSYLSLRAGSPFFFAAANPTIENGGMFFESKKLVYAKIPEQLYPPTIHAEANVDADALILKMASKGMGFPVVAKPDRGERGWLVKIINTIEELYTYAQTVQRPFLLQTYIDYPVELSIFYVRHPNAATGKISSITGKKFLSVTGDGKRSVKELIFRNPRAFLQRETLMRMEQIELNQVLPAGEEKILVRIGNHARGTTFLNCNHQIDEALEKTIDRIAQSIDGFYYGRLDIVCENIELLKAEKNFFILELNGAGAEPAHIYQPGYSYFKAQADIMHHFKMMFDIARHNHRNGHPYMSLSTYRNTKREEKKFKSTLKNSDL